MNPILTASEWLLRKLEAASPAKQAAHLELGERGESEAYHALCRMGMQVVAQRWKTRGHRGDIDLIAWDGPTLCFVEVKARSSRGLGLTAAESAVDQDKRLHLRRLARRYLDRLPRREGTPSPRVRFDILSVYFAGKQRNATAEIQHFPAAYGWYERSQDRY